jgi:hypothetical protein
VLKFPSLAVGIALISSDARAGERSECQRGRYTYEEPGDLSISIHGPKIGGGYTGTLSLGKSWHWFAQADGHLR